MNLRINWLIAIAVVFSTTFLSNDCEGKQKSTGKSFSPAATVKYDLEKEDKPLFAIGTIITGNMTLIFDQKPLSQSPCGVMEKAMASLGISSPTKKEVLTLMRSAIVAQSKGEFREALRCTLDIFNGKLQKEVIKKYGLRALNVMSFGLNTKLLLEISSKIYMPFETVSARGDGSVFQGFVNTIGSFEANAEEIENLDDRIRDEVDSALSTIKDGECDLEDVKVIRKKVTNILHIYEL